MGTARSESTCRWVWVGNPFSPVHENASFELGPYGNLVLSDSDGHKVWETTTSNKGIVGLNILPNGNVVLYNDRNEFVRQSFEHPSDTLLVDQSLNINGPNKLVSKNGAYSLVLERYGIMMYIDNVMSKPTKYGILSSWRKERQTYIQFQCEGEYGRVDAYELRFNEILVRPKYNAVLSFLRIEDDGNLVVYTYYNPVDWRAWEKTFAYFSSEPGRVDNCKLPSRCGSLGLCKDEMCVACPTRSGLLGWSENRVVPELGNCKKGKVTGFYKVEGVENFMKGRKRKNEVRGV